MDRFAVIDWSCLAAGFLVAAVLMSPNYAWSGQDTVVAPSRRSMQPGAIAAPPADAEVSATIAALLVMAEQQIRDGRIWAPSDDNASTTFMALRAILPAASVSDLRIVQGLPSRFTRNAGAAITAGQYEQARAFLWWAAVFVTD